MSKTYYDLGLEKVANFTPSPSRLSSLAGTIKDVTGIATATIGLTTLTSFGIKAILNKIQNDTRRKAIIEDLMSTDMIIKEAPKDQVLEYYATIYNLAPTISLEKPVVREMLQHFVKFGRIDLQTIKTLGEAESKAAGNLLGGGINIKSLIKI